MTSVPLAPGILGQLARNSTAAPPALFLWPVPCLRFQRLHLPSRVIHSLAPLSSYGNLLCWRHLCPHCAQICAQNNAHPIADPDLPGAILLSLPLLSGVFTYLYLSICVFSCSPGPPTAETVHCPSIIRRAVMWLQLRALSQRPAARVSTFASFRQLWSISVAFCIWFSSIWYLFEYRPIEKVSKSALCLIFQNCHIWL